MYAGRQGDFVHFFWAVVIIALKGWRVMQACDGAMMLAMARECRIKNRDKAVPEGYAEAMPTKGNA